MRETIKGKWKLIPEYIKRKQAVVRNITNFLTNIFAITDIQNEVLLFRKGG